MRTWGQGDMAGTLTARPRARDAVASPDNALGWVYVVVAFMVCTFVICHAFPEDVPRSTLSKDVWPDPGSGRASKAQDLG